MKLELHLNEVGIGQMRVEDMGEDITEIKWNKELKKIIHITNSYKFMWNSYRKSHIGIHI